MRVLWCGCMIKLLRWMRGTDIMKMKLNNKRNLYWKAHIPNLFKEIVECNPEHNNIFKCPLMIIERILIEIAKRAEELDDPELKLLCCRLTLYEIADPESKEYNPAVFKILEDMIRKGDNKDEQ